MTQVLVGGMPVSQVVQERQQVPDLLRLHQVQLRSLGVRRLGLFGSFVHRQQGRGSDVDLLVEFGPDTLAEAEYVAFGP